MSFTAISPSIGYEPAECLLYVCVKLHINENYLRTLKKKRKMPEKKKDKGLNVRRSNFTEFSVNTGTSN